MGPGAARIAAVLASAAAVTAACSSVVITGNTGGAPGSSSSVAASSVGSSIGGSSLGGASSTSTSSEAPSSSSSSSGMASSTSSSSTSGVTSSSASGGSCAGACVNDAQCQNACPNPGPGMTSCCGAFGCYMAPACPPPCVPGGACQPGNICSGNPFDPNNCVIQCSCDPTGHYVCTLYSDLPSCPAVHPLCGAPCNPSPELYCMCSTDGGTNPCTCDPATSTWNCAWPGLCGLFDSPPQAQCNDFPVGKQCGDVCWCGMMCGVQVWTCTI